MKSWQIMIFICLIFAGKGFTGETKRGGSDFPPKIEGTKTEVYKTIGDTKLTMYIYASQAGISNAPAIVFFFGGGWTGGTPKQFEDQCRCLASRGMVAMAADYRVKSRQGVKPVQCVADARSAIRWVRANAARLGVDSRRIAAGGGSAGGHIAACTALVSEFDEPAEDKNISAAPDALVLFNPALVLAPMEGVNIDKSFGAKVPEERLGTKPENISPAHHVKTGVSPAIIFHGRADTVVPFATAEAFATRMKQAGNRCELIGYDGQPHGFFNREPWKGKTLQETDKFLTSLGWLKEKQ